MEIKEEQLEGLTREELSALEKDELIEIVLFLQDESAYWKHRFQCADKERELICWQYRVPTI